MVLAAMVVPSIGTAADWLTGLKITIGVSPVYDDNILRYSDKYITRFDNRQDEGRFHISTRDDLILVNTLRGAATLNVFGSLATTVSLDARRRTYTHNAVKNWSSFNAGVRQELSRRLSVQAAYAWIPAFYVRHYRDDDWVEEFGYVPASFQPFAFTKDETGGSVFYTPFAGTRVRGGVSSMRYFYNEHFTEYNCRNTLLGCSLTQSVGRKIRLTAGFEAVFSRGDGNGTMDPSFDENSFSLGGAFDLPALFGMSHSMGLDGEYARRCYGTKHPWELDQNHAGRQDHDYRLNITWAIDLFTNCDVEISWAWHRRDTETSATQNAEYLSAEKDYRQHQVAMEIRYTFDLLSSETSERKR